MIRVVIPYYSDFEIAKNGLRSMREAKINFQLSAHQGSLIYVSRNRGVNNGKSQSRMQSAVSDFSHFLFVDSDISFTAENVKSLLDLKAPIAACPYRCHDNPNKYQTGHLDLLGLIMGKDSIETKGVHSRSYIGAGFLLVENSVFRHLPYPWFHHRMIEKYNCREQSGEDVGFCLSAREAGFSIKVNFNSPVEHFLRTFEQFNLDF